MARLTDLAIEECRIRFEAGDPKALLDAIDFCARSGTAMPEWLGGAFIARYEKWARYGARTLDEAFGIDRKGERIPDRELRKYLQARVAMEVARLHNKEGLPLDAALFERVGEKFGVSTSTASDIYYTDNPWKRIFEAWPPEEYGTAQGPLTPTIDP